MPTNVIDDKALMLCRRFRFLEAQRTNFDTYWQELAEFLNPQQSNIIRKDFPGQKRTKQLFASAMLNAVSTSVAAISGILVPTTSKWFDLSLRDPFLMEIEGVEEWLEICSNIMFDHITNSNLKNMIGRIIRDLLVQGTGCIFVTQKDGIGSTFGGLNFMVYQVGSFIIAENHEGMIDSVFQKMEMSARAMSLQWGKENLSEKTRNLLDKTPDKMVEILHVSIPREEVNPANITLQTPMNKLPWTSIYIELTNKHLISESGFFEQAYMCPRWMVLSGEIYGRSPGMDALPEVKSLNKIRELVLKGLNKTIDPPLAVMDKGIVGKVSTTPGSIVYEKVPNSIRPIFLGIDFGTANFNEQNMENTVRQIFFNHLLQFPTQGGSTPVSATEFALRNEQMLRNAIPSISVIEEELLAPLVVRVFGILLRANQLPPPPPELMLALGGPEGDGGPLGLNIQYSNPVSKAQKSAEGDSLVRFLSIATSFSEVFPNILSVIKEDKAGLFLADKMSVPKSIMRTEEELLAIEEQKAQQAQAEAEAQQSLQATEGLENVGGFLKDTGLNQ
jgi:hypothetical protein